MRSTPMNSCVVGRGYAVCPWAGGRPEGAADKWLGRKKMGLWWMFAPWEDQPVMSFASHDEMRAWTP